MLFFSVMALYTLSSMELLTTDAAVEGDAEVPIALLLVTAFTRDDDATPTDRDSRKVLKPTST
jgi:hypothetical protein